MAPRRARVLGDQGEHPQALRRHLIEVTQAMLSAHGLNGLTTRAIAHEARVADGVLYNHFADKDDLVVSALHERVAALGEAFAAGCPRAGEQDLHDGLTLLVRHCRQFQAETFPLVAGLLGRPDLLHALFARLHAEGPVPPIVWRDIVAYVRGEQEVGTVSPQVTPETVASVIFGATQLDALRAPLGQAAPDLGRAAAGDPADGAPSDDPAVERLVLLLVRACRP